MIAIFHDVVLVISDAQSVFYENVKMVHFSMQY